MRVALGIPVLGMIHGACAYSHMGLAAEIAKEADLFIPQALNYTPYSRGRVVIFGEAIEHDCTHVMFADADNMIPQGAFGALLRMMESEDRARLVTGYYLRRKPPFTTVWTFPETTTYTRDEPEPEPCKKPPREYIADGSPVDLAGCGLGCALIDLTWCQEHLSIPYFYMPDNGGTEDYPFCRRIRENQGRVIGHTGVVCGHMPDLLPVTPANRDEHLALAAKHSAYPCMGVRERQLETV